MVINLLFLNEEIAALQPTTNNLFECSAISWKLYASTKKDTPNTILWVSVQMFCWCLCWTCPSFKMHIRLRNDTIKKCMFD